MSGFASFRSSVRRALYDLYCLSVFLPKISCVEEAREGFFVAIVFVKRRKIPKKDIS